MSAGVGRSGHAVRVAGVTTAILAVLYVVVAGVLDVVIVSRLHQQVDHRLAGIVARAASLPSPGGDAARLDGGGDVDDAPVLVWAVDAGGKATLLSPRGPDLPVRHWRPGPATMTLGGSQFRLAVQFSHGGGSLVAGESLASVNHVRSVLLIVEAVVAPFILAATFLLALVVGLKAAAPVERTRRRQLEFTADASHELRTPLSVIEAEVDLALSGPRDNPYYRASLERVGSESKRLRRIVEDLLWLARFDAQPPLPAIEPIDLEAAAAVGIERFSALASSRNIDLALHRGGIAPALVKVAADWVDRVLGVLVDNALRYTPAGGAVSVTVATGEGRVRLVVEDDGPGIPEAERPLLFDRFHRASSQPGGAGLGLAIADAVVRSTGGRWTIGVSTSGGARMEIAWPIVHIGGRHPSGARVAPEGSDVRSYPAEQQRAPGGSDGDGGDQRPPSQPGGPGRSGGADPVGDAQRHRVAKVPEHVDSSGAEPNDKAGLVDHEQPGVPARPGQ